MLYFGCEWNERSRVISRVLTVDGVSPDAEPTLENVELIHLKKDKDGSQRAVKQTLAEYWTEGVTARINNSRDVHKPPLSAADVISSSLKVRFSSRLRRRRGGIASNRTEPAAPQPHSLLRRPWPNRTGCGRTPSSSLLIVDTAKVDAPGSSATPQGTFSIHSCSPVRTLCTLDATNDDGRLFFRFGGIFLRSTAVLIVVERLVELGRGEGCLEMLKMDLNDLLNEI